MSPAIVSSTRRKRAPSIPSDPSSFTSTSPRTTSAYTAAAGENRHAGFRREGRFRHGCRERHRSGYRLRARRGRHEGDARGHRESGARESGARGTRDERNGRDGGVRRIRCAFDGRGRRRHDCGVRQGARVVQQRGRQQRRTRRRTRRRRLELGDRRELPRRSARLPRIPAAHQTAGRRRPHRQHVVDGGPARRHGRLGTVQLDEVRRRRTDGSAASGRARQAASVPRCCAPAA